MKEVEFSVPSGCDLGSAERLIEAVCLRRGLQVTMKGSLATFPGSIHWHYKNQSQKGTLELTLHVPSGRIWAQVQNGRRAEWIDLELPGLQRAIERELRQSLAQAAADER
jgi:hypothetical protein